MLFSTVAHEIVLVAHDGVDRDIVRAMGFAFSTGMPALKVA
jgi:hypothetical protein